MSGKSDFHFHAVEVLLQDSLLFLLGLPLLNQLPALFLEDRLVRVHQRLKFFFVLAQSGDQLFLDLDFLVLEHLHAVEKHAQLNVVQLGVAQVADSVLFLCVFGEVLVVPGAGATHGVPALLAEEVTVPDAEDRHHREGRLAHLTVVLLCAFLLVAGPRVWQSKFLVKFVFLQKLGDGSVLLPRVLELNWNNL